MSTDPESEPGPTGEEGKAAGGDEKKSHPLRNTAIVVAVLGLVGALGVAVIEGTFTWVTTAWEEGQKQPDSEPSQGASPEGPGIPANESGEIAVETPPAEDPPEVVIDGYDCEPIRDASGNAPEGVIATVVYTEGLGLNTFCGPGNHYDRGSPENYPESERVTIVCQVRDGQVLSDTADVPGRYQGEWPVWNKLSNGLWVADLYVDTPKEEGGAPPEGIALCEGSA